MNKTFLLLCVVLLSGCGSSSKQSCQELDWYEIGRTDGLKGLQNNQRRQVRTTCESSDESLNEAFYNNGFDAGIAQYCTKANGFESAVADLKINSSACPLGLSDEFAAGYEAGKRYSQLTAENQSLHKRIYDVNLKLNSGVTDTIVKGILRGEKLELESKSQALEQEMANLHRSVSNTHNQAE